jgi:hypothetical protein
LGAILQWSIGKSLMKECRVSHFVWRELNKWFPMTILGSYLVFKREPRNKWMCMEAHWKGNILAITQTSMKRMLAYSSIGQIRYVIIGIIVGD